MTRMTAALAALGVLAAASMGRGDVAETKSGLVKRIGLAVCGAMQRDDFSDGVLDKGLWWFWNSNPGIQVEEADGQVRIHGVAQPSKGLAQVFNGIVSPRCAQTDAVLAVEISCPGLKSHEGAGYYVHMCGSLPDRYPEVVFGGSFARKWWFNWVEDGGRCVADERMLPAFGDEAGAFHEVKVEHDGRTHLAAGFVKGPQGWRQIGGWHRCVMTVSRAELKIYVDKPGQTYDVRFRNFRLYPRAQNHPVKFVVYDEKAYSAPGIEVRLYAGDALVGAATTDADGYCLVPLDGAPWEVYPASAGVRLFRDGRQVGEGAIAAGGVNGLYPGDIWAIVIAHQGGDTP